MATQPQIDANRLNALHSTGPRTESGKQASSQNHLTLGLYTRTDYVKPEERDFYQEFCETMYSELSPLGMLEDTLAHEIVGASWRLRRCDAAEGQLADFDDSTDKTRRSIERARGSAHSHFHRAINQLRKMQTEREIRIAVYGQDKPGVADWQKVETARKKQQRSETQVASREEDALLAAAMKFCEPDPDVMKQLDKEFRELYCGQPQTGHAPSGASLPGKPQSASNCSEPAKVAEAVKETEEELAEAALEAEFDRKFFAADEATQLRMLAEREERSRKEFEAILKAL